MTLSARKRILFRLAAESSRANDYDPADSVPHTWYRAGYVAGLRRAVLIILAKGHDPRDNRRAEGRADS